MGHRSGPVAQSLCEKSYNLVTLIYFFFYFIIVNIREMICYRHHCCQKGLNYRNMSSHTLIMTIININSIYTALYEVSKCCTCLKQEFKKTFQDRQLQQYKLKWKKISQCNIRKEGNNIKRQGIKLYACIYNGF